MLPQVHISLYFFESLDLPLSQSESRSNINSKVDADPDPGFLLFSSQKFIKFSGVRKLSKF